MNRYETIFVTRPSAEGISNKELENKFQKLIKKKKGKIHIQQDWGKQRLAYEVKREIKGQYHYLGFEGTSELLKEVEQLFRLDESVIKFQSHRVEGEFDAQLITPSSAPDRYPPGKSHGYGDFERPSRSHPFPSSEKFQSQNTDESFEKGGEKPRTESPDAKEDK